MLAIMSAKSHFLFVSWLAAVLSTLPAFVRSAVAAPAEPPPVQQDAAGKRAWELLGSYYRQDQKGYDNLNAAADAALRDLGSGDPGKAKEAAALLLGLLRQAAADEENGRAEWHHTPYWGGGPESKARNYHTTLASLFEKSASSEAAVPVAEWLLREDLLADSQSAAVAALERCQEPAGNQAILNLLENGAHFRPAIVMALGETAKRKLHPKPEAVRKWTLDPRLSIRGAAAEALEAIGAGPAPEFKPEDGFNEATQKLLRNLLALMPDPPDATTPFGRFDISEDDWTGKIRKYSLTGWLRSEKEGVMQISTWFGASSELKVDPSEKRTVEFNPSDGKDVVTSIRQIRETKDKEARHNLMDTLSAEGGFSGQFEPGMLSAPEGLLAAWLYLKGDKASAATLLFPVLDALDDDRWAFQIVRDLVAKYCHQAMLEAFSHRRDYQQSIVLARHLSQPLFDGYKYQARARELAAQLPQRTDDFKTLVLPSAEDWKQTAATLPREKQVEFLASRLRLLNCFQYSQPGDVDYSDEQFAAAGSRWEKLNKGGQSSHGHQSL